MRSRLYTNIVHIHIKEYFYFVLVIISFVYGFFPFLSQFSSVVGLAKRVFLIEFSYMFIYTLHLNNAYNRRPKYIENRSLHGVGNMCGWCVYYLHMCG